MSAHFDGGAEIAGRRLREVEVSYVDDPTLDLEGQDSDSCPPSPPPTYYLRVREDSQKCAVDISNGARQEEKSVKKECEEAVGSSAASWNWRYVNVEKKALLVWNRRGGKLLRSIPLADVDSLRVVSDQDAPGSILEVNIKATMASPPNCSGDTKDEVSSKDVGILILQARSRRETLLWAKVLQENVEHMVKRVVPLENLDQQTSLDDVQELAKLLTHQLSALQQEQQPSRRQSVDSDGKAEHPAASSSISKVDTSGG